MPSPQNPIIYVGRLLSENYTLRIFSYIFLCFFVLLNLDVSFTKLRHGMIDCLDFSLEKSDKWLIDCIFISILKARINLFSNISLVIIFLNILKLNITPLFQN